MKLANYHAASLQTQLVLTRCQGRAETMPQRSWQQRVQENLMEWLAAGGLHGVTASDPSRTKTAAKGRRSLASQRDSDEECEFTQVRIRNAAA